MSPRRSAPSGPPVSIPRPGPIGPTRMPPRQAPRISTGSGASTRRHKRARHCYNELAKAGLLSCRSVACVSPKRQNEAEMANLLARRKRREDGLQALRCVRIAVVMGVSGAGKTTVGAALARRLGWQFQEGDALHPPENVARMQAGIPLGDADRAPWLRAVAARIDKWRERGEAGVITCSALKRRYRDT